MRSLFRHHVVQNGEAALEIEIIKQNTAILEIFEIMMAGAQNIMGAVVDTGEQ